MRRLIFLIFFNGLIYLLLILSIMEIETFSEKPFKVLSEWAGSFLIIAAAGSVLRWFSPRDKQLFWILFMIMFGLIGIVLFFLY